jgi:hypothetical protein
VSEEPKGGLQFDRAEFEQPQPASPVCAGCGQAVWNVYYAVNGQMLCERCKAELELHANQGSGAGRFLRAAFNGLGAGAVGAAVWYAVRAATGYEVGLIAIGVGLFVGGAVRKGSNGRGGWPYQALAMFLTYASIVSTHVPEMLRGANKDLEATASAALLVVRVVVAFIVAFALPFLGGLNIMGIVIIAIALYEAWKINKKASLEITGPHRVGAAVEPAAAPLGPGLG